MILRGVPPTCTPDVVMGSTGPVTPGGGAAVIFMLVFGTTVGAGVTPLLEDGVTVTPAGKLVPPGVTLTWLLPFFLTRVNLLGSMIVVELVAVVLTNVVPVIRTIVVVVAAAVGAPDACCCSAFSSVTPPVSAAGSGVCVKNMLIFLNLKKPAKIIKFYS
jgi:hypothetical protein